MRVYNKALTLIFIIVCLYYTDREKQLIKELLEKTYKAKFGDLKKF